VRRLIDPDRRPAETLGDRFASRMAVLGPWGARPIAIAISGGADSLALAILARDWCSVTGRRMLALTVDHGLRPEAAEEVHAVATLMAAYAIPCQMLKIPPLEYGTAIAARARNARYEALFMACRQAGIVDLLLGHHARDQAETILLRAESASGEFGLAGIAAVSVRDGIRLVRPLLDTNPVDLRHELTARGLCWIEDPSNQDQRSTRIRLRAELTDDREVASLIDRAAHAGTERAQSELQTARWLALHASIRPEGFAHLDCETSPPEALSALIRTIAGRGYPPPAASIAALVRALHPATLAGARIIKAPRNAPGFLILREQAAIASPQQAEENSLWDRRFRLIRRGDLPIGATIGALGADAARYRDHSDLPAAVLRTLPAIREDGRILCIPLLSAGPRNPDRGTQVQCTPPVPVAGALFRTLRG